MRSRHEVAIEFEQRYAGTAGDHFNRNAVRCSGGSIRAGLTALARTLLVPAGEGMAGVTGDTAKEARVSEKKPFFSADTSMLTNSPRSTLDGPCPCSVEDRRRARVDDGLMTRVESSARPYRYRAVRGVPLRRLRP